MAGRTHPRWTRVYIDGYDMSGYSRSMGQLNWGFNEADLTCQMSDEVMGYLPGRGMIGAGPLNGVFDNTATSGLHVIGSSIQSERVITVAIGDRAAPAAGDPTFSAQLVQTGYHAADDGGAAVVNIPFGAWEQANLIDYKKPWGNLLHALSAATAANSSGTGVDQVGGATSWGGFMVYHVTAGDGTATITVEHSTEEVDGSYAALGGCTSGELDMSSVQSGIVPTTATTTTVNQYLRWQISLNTATTVTFALAFVRGNKEQ